MKRLKVGSELERSTISRPVYFFCLFPSVTQNNGGAICFSAIEWYKDSHGGGSASAHISSLFSHFFAFTNSEFSTITCVSSSSYDRLETPVS